VHFAPAPARIIQADPVVEWQLRLPAERSLTIGYRATVPAAGATAARLARWVRAFNTLTAGLSAPKAVTIQLRALIIKPQTLRIARAATAQLALSVQLSKGGRVPRQILSGAAWTAANPAVAVVNSSGLVTGIGSGTTSVTAQIGKARAVIAVIAVTVTGSSSLAAGGAPATVGGGGSGSHGSGVSGVGGGSTSGAGKPTPRSTVVTPATTAPAPVSDPAPASSSAQAPAPPPPPPPAPSTHSETVGGVTHTWTNYSNAGGTEGSSIPSNQTVQVSCKVQGFKVADGDTWWYRIASSPWNNAFYASADAFYNDGQTPGSLTGTPFVDGSVPNC